VSSAEALAFFVQDTIAAGRLTLTPGVRFESIDYEQRNYGRNDPGRTGAALAVRENGVDVWIPGLGASWQATGALLVFAGVHRGFAPPGPGRAEQTEAEESVNYELGLRTAGRPLALELVGFYNDYDNLLGADTLSSGGGGTGELFNGGAVEVVGLEAAARWDLGRARGWAVGVPLRLAYTWTEAEFETSFVTDFADWAPAVEKGDELPYLPAHQLAAGAGLVAERWGAHLDLTWVDAMRTSAGQGPIPEGEGTDAHLLLDLAADLRLAGGLSAFVQVRNLTDEVYVAARRPAGARPGLPRTALAGLSWDF
jgi:Fe(3+) dicitrate transport protein